MIEQLKLEFSKKMEVNPNLVKVRKLRKSNLVIKGEKISKKRSLLTTFNCRLNIQHRSDCPDEEVIKELEDIINSLEALNEDETIYSFSYSHEGEHTGAFATEERIVHIFRKIKEES